MLKTYVYVLCFVLQLVKKVLKLYKEFEVYNYEREGKNDPERETTDSNLF